MKENEKGIVQENSWGDNIVGFPGDLRDHFAAQALPSLIGDDKYMERKCTATVFHNDGYAKTKTLDETNAGCIARQAYFLADAMIKERVK